MAMGVMVVMDDGVVAMGATVAGVVVVIVVMMDGVQHESPQPDFRSKRGLFPFAMDYRAGERFINQDHASVVGRQKRWLMAQLRESRRTKTKKRMLKKPAVRPVPRPGNRHRKYPCCGRRKERCVCDWSDLEARLDSAAWGAFLLRLEQAQLKYVSGSVFRVRVSHAIGRFRFLCFGGGAPPHRPSTASVMTF